MGKFILKVEVVSKDDVPVRGGFEEVDDLIRQTLAIKDSTKSIQVDAGLLTTSKSLYNMLRYRLKARRGRPQIGVVRRGAKVFLFKED